MELNLKKTLALIFAILFAFTLFWFIKFGTFLWFASWVGGELSKSNQQIIAQQQKVIADRKREQQALERQRATKKQQDYARRTQISFGDNSKKLSEQDKTCNNAILAAMADKSAKAKQAQKDACAHNIQQ